jgi:DNA-binding CsgD family transcriptional regulator
MVARQLLNRLQAKPADDKAVDADNGRLTRREHEILVMITKGFSYAETSQISGIAALRSHHLKSIYRKARSAFKTEAVYEARRRSLIRPHFRARGRGGFALGTLSDANDRSFPAQIL